MSAVSSSDDSAVTRAETSAGAGRGGSTAMRAPGRGAPTGGLTSSGATVLLAALAGAGALADAVISRELAWLFLCGFVAGCAWVGWRIRRRSQRTALVAPPLVYAAVVLVASLFRGGSGIGSRALHLAELLGDRAPTLLTGLAVVGVLLLLRRRRG